MVSSVELQKGFPAGHIPSLPVRASSKGRAVASKEDFDRRIKVAWALIRGSVRALPFGPHHSAFGRHFKPASIKRRTASLRVTPIFAA
jgi:hypothetical protein